MLIISIVFRGSFQIVIEGTTFHDNILKLSRIRVLIVRVGPILLPFQDTVVVEVAALLLQCSCGVSRFLSVGWAEESWVRANMCKG